MRGLEPRGHPPFQRPGLAYLRRPPGSPPLPVGPRRRPPTLGELRGSRRPAPRLPACPTSAARAGSVSAASRLRLRKQPKAKRARQRRAERSRAEPGAGRSGSPAEGWLWPDKREERGRGGYWVILVACFYGRHLQESTKSREDSGKRRRKSWYP